MTTEPKIEHKILLVWEEIPDSAKVYLIPAFHALAEIILRSHGLYINGDDLAEDAPIRTLNLWLEPKYSEHVENDSKGPVRIADSEADQYLLYTRGNMDEPVLKPPALGLDVHIVAIVVCGFFL